MSKRNLILLSALLALASCADHKKPTEAKVAEINMSAAVEEEVEPQVVYFDGDSIKLSKEALSIINKEVYSEARNPKTIRVNIEGRCDSPSALALSAKRVKAIRLFLLTNGVKAAKLRTVGCGKNLPADLEKDRAAVVISFKKLSE